MEDVFAGFLKELANRAKLYRPLAADTLRKFQEAKNAAQEKKPTGGATAKARQAQQKLRNPELNSTHFGKAKAVSAVLVKKTGEDLQKAVTEVFAAYALHEQMRVEYSLHDRDEPQSREQGPATEKADVIRFIEALGQYDVSPHMLGRLYEWMYGLIARLILDANSDRNFERPDNIWRLLKNAGIFEAYNGELTNDQARILEGISAVRENPDALDRWERFDLRFPNLGDLPAGFKTRCMHMLDLSNEFGPAEESVIFDARGRQYLAQTETIGKLLGIPADKLSTVDELVRFMHDPTWSTKDSEKQLHNRLVVNLLLLHFDECDHQEIHPSEWLSSLVPKLLHEDGFIARHVRSEDAFWGLTFIALELSSFRDREETSLVRQRKSANDGTRDVMTDFYQRHGINHHTDADGVPWAGEAPTDPDEADIPEYSNVETHSELTDSSPPAHLDEDDHILEAEFTDIMDDHSPAEPAPAATQFAEQDRSFGSSTTNNFFEEFE
ncbi:MAG: hypothetical protein JHD10_00500 [Sphingomonadaceae bacterium]|nr:hypothetical protein [Sphingomonadaceae bacterium]